MGAGLALACLLCIAVDSSISAQGRGRGGGRPAGVGQPMGSPGVDRGLGTASRRSDGRSDIGLGRASARSDGRSDAGIDRARAGRNNAASLSDTELNRYRGLSRRLGTTPAEMRARYAAALAVNPDLTHGQFVAAHVIADNFRTRHPQITSTAILAGLASGDSLGRTLRNLGLSKDQAKAAEKDAERRIKEAKSRNR